MKIEEKISVNNTAEIKTKHSHSRHMKMMVICCGVPLLGFIAIGVFSISPSLETLLLVICPVGMGAMMWMMLHEQRSDNSEQSCCQSDAVHEERSEHDKNHISADVLKQANVQIYKNKGITE